VADGKITLEELDAALHNAVTERNIRLGGQGAFYNPPEEPATYEFNMEAFQRSARAIAAPESALQSSCATQGASLRQVSNLMF
jgi:hypothetical protein